MFEFSYDCAGYTTKHECHVNAFRIMVIEAAAQAGQRLWCNGPCREKTVYIVCANYGASTCAFKLNVRRVSGTLERGIW